MARRRVRVSRKLAPNLPRCWVDIGARDRQPREQRWPPARACSRRSRRRIRVPVLRRRYAGAHHPHVVFEDGASPGRGTCPGALCRRAASRREAPGGRRSIVRRSRPSGSTTSPSSTASEGRPLTGGGGGRVLARSGSDVVLDDPAQRSGPCRRPRQPPRCRISAGRDAPLRASRRSRGRHRRHDRAAAGRPGPERPGDPPAAAPDRLRQSRPSPAGATASSTTSSSSVTPTSSGYHAAMA